MGKAEENKRKKREALLLRAYELFTTKGTAQTTIADIAFSADVGKGTFYSYFKDKDDLIETLIGEKATALLTAAAAKLSKRSEITSVEDRFIFIAEELIDELASDQVMLRFINKNLNYGFFKRSLLREDISSDFDIRTEYIKLITSDGSTWNEPELMLFTIVELISSTCVSVILDENPTNLDTYKPYLFNSIRGIIAAFRA